MGPFQACENAEGVVSLAKLGLFFKRGFDLAFA
jgi:hypothetical protein